MNKMERLRAIGDKYALDLTEVGRDVRVLSVFIFNDFKHRQGAVNALLGVTHCTRIHFYDNAITLDLSLEEE